MATFTYFVNTPSGTIPTTPSAPYLTGLTTIHAPGTLVTGVSLAFYGFNHTFTGDLEIVLEYTQGPTTRYLQVMSDVGGSDDLVNATLEFSDSASETLQFDSTGQPIASGSYRPLGLGAAERYVDFFPGGSIDPIPAGTGNGTVSFASQFGGLDASANWDVYVLDDFGGDQGGFESWSLTLSTNSDSGSIRFVGPSTVISFSSTSATDGFYSSSDGSYVEYSGVTGWVISSGQETASATVFAGAGNDAISGSKFGSLLAYGGDGEDGFDGGLNRDSLFGGNGNDLLYINRLLDGSELMAGEIYDGGTGYDVLSVIVPVLGTTDFDMRNVTLRSIEELRFDVALSAAYEIRLRDTQLGSGLSASALIDMRQSSPGVTQALTFYMGLQNSLNLSSLAFTSNFGAEDYIGIVGDSSNETLTGSSQRDVISARAGNDFIFGGAGNDLLSGEEGGDNLWGGLGADQHVGGIDAVVDYARYDDANYGNLLIRLDNAALNTGAAAGDTYTEIDGLVGGAGNDTVHGDGQNNFLFGSGGADQVYGGVGNDYLDGGAGGDNLWGGLGADVHVGGNDSGVDYARYDDANHGNLTIMLGNPSMNIGAAAVGDTYTGIEGLVGGAGDDSIHGDGNRNFLFGSAGNDLIYGGAGNDYLDGGASGDFLWGGLGADQHIGGDGPGLDFAAYNDSNYGNLTIRLDAPSANAGAAAVGDTYTGIEGLVGGLGNDVIIGNSLANDLRGDSGGDFIDGLGGNDFLFGGIGADRFRFSTAIGAGNVDLIFDFEVGIDDILLAQSIFSAIGPSLTADEFRIGAAVDANDYVLYDSASGLLIYDVNGNGAGGATHIATLVTGLALTVADFVMV